MMLGFYAAKKMKGICLPAYKGPFINYVRVPWEGGLEKSLSALNLGRGVKPIVT